MLQRVLVIGLGRMGFALAATLLKNDYPVAVWNRTESKAAPLVEAGATLAGCVAEGIDANDLIVICVSNYPDAALLLEDSGDLSGKTVVQLTSASSSDARAMGAWVIQRGGLYLDGEILSFPSDVGTKECRILAAGSQDAWREAKPVVMCLGSNSRYLGEKVSAPAALNAALMFSDLALTMAMVQGVQIIEKEGMDIDEYVGMLAEIVSANDGREIRRQGNAIARNAFGDTEAALETWEAAIVGLVEDHARLGIDVGFPRAICSLLNRAAEAGYGKEEVAAVIKVMRNETPPTSEGAPRAAV
jgi:3-hydroxyisobutyrate dehydrogenase-like beta-hydroxyacid dehydrogenase